MVYQDIDIEDLFPEYQQRKNFRNKEIAEEFHAIKKKLEDLGFDTYFTAPIYKKLAKEFGVSIWTVRRAVANSK